MDGDPPPIVPKVNHHTLAEIVREHPQDDLKRIAVRYQRRTGILFTHQRISHAIGILKKNGILNEKQIKQSIERKDEILLKVAARVAKEDGNIDRDDFYNEAVPLGFPLNFITLRLRTMIQDGRFPYRIKRQVNGIKDTEIAGRIEMHKQRPAAILSFVDKRPAPQPVKTTLKEEVAEILKDHKGKKNPLIDRPDAKEIDP